MKNLCKKLLVHLLSYVEKTRVCTFHPFPIVCEMLPLYNVTALWVFRGTDGLYHSVGTTHRVAALSQTDCSTDHERTLE